MHPSETLEETGVRNWRGFETQDFSNARQTLNRKAEIIYFGTLWRRQRMGSHGHEMPSTPCCIWGFLVHTHNCGAAQNDTETGIKQVAPCSNVYFSPSDA